MLRLLISLPFQIDIEEMNDAIEISFSQFFEMEGIPNLMKEFITDDPKVGKNNLRFYIYTLYTFINVFLMCSFH